MIKCRQKFRSSSPHSATKLYGWISFCQHNLPEDGQEFGFFIPEHEKNDKKSSYFYLVGEELGVAIKWTELLAGLPGPVHGRNEGADRVGYK